MNYEYSAFFLSTWGNDWGIIGQSFSLVFICVLIFILTYYLNRYISRARISGKMGGNICIVEVVSVGLQSTIQLIKVGKKYILIGVSKDRIAFLSEIDPADIEIPQHNPIINKNIFDKYLNKFLNKNNSIDSGDDDEIV